MFARLNYAVLGVSLLLSTYYYMKSARPGSLVKKLGTVAYIKCSQQRMLSAIFMGLAAVNYVIYFFCPLRLSIPRTFPWSWNVSAVMAVAIAIPAGYIWWRGLADARGESLLVKESADLFGGIYKKIRHPQAVGELPFWWVLALLLHSPFLTLFSILWIPMYVMMCWAEELDLPLRYGQSYEEYRKTTGAVLPRKNQ